MRKSGSFEFDDDGGKKARWWCPGCQREHKVQIGEKKAGNCAIAFDEQGRPSIKTTGAIGVVEEERGVTCLSYLRAGEVKFVLEGTSHELKGQRVAIPEADPVPVRGR